MLAALLPGLEPEDITITIADETVWIETAARGVHPSGMSPDAHVVLLDEWATGPAYREYTLPQAVDGSLANVTYGNGVLVVVLPTLPAGQPTARPSSALRP